ncbi:MAG TPA: hypothetical protein VLC79_02975, partial [Cellvibrio sp.]|nr:hypothetical protein [Cellvibrio sp.]
SQYQALQLSDIRIHLKHALGVAADLLMLLKQRVKIAQLINIECCQRNTENNNREKAQQYLLAYAELFKG